MTIRKEYSYDDWMRVRDRHGSSKKLLAGRLKVPEKARLMQLVTRCVHTGREFCARRVVKVVVEGKMYDGRRVIVFEDMRDGTQHAVARIGTVAMNGVHPMKVNGHG